ncbi:AMP-binding protein [Brevibacterium album]|uniref:AMP-binding protein n=1 Tax=Brevibacterium album TaxID=417948 RepID=UPI000406E48E|nr:AMP-binding protein [Brevibacterium album]
MTSNPQTDARPGPAAAAQTLTAPTPEEQLALSRRLHWMNMLSLHAHSRAEDIALTGPDAVLTWGELAARVSAVAADLQERGVGAGDRVFVLGLNSVAHATALLAINSVGGIAVPLNIRSTAAEVEYLVADSGAVMGFADAMGAGILADAPEASKVPHIVFGEQFDAIAASERTHAFVDVPESETALIVYTSGTTSAPKGVMLTHLNFAAQAINTNRLGPAGTDDEAAMIVVPLFHIAGLGFLYPAFFNGTRTVIAPPQALMRIERLADLIEEERVTKLFLVPTLWQALCSLPGIRERGLPLTGISWGASPASRETLQLMADTFPDAVISAAFGQTEMSPTTCALTGEDSFRKMGSVGKPIGMVAARVIDAEGRDVAPGETGEIVYRGPGYMQGYWNKPKQTAEAAAGGWFHSGDLVRVDEEGFHYVVDRAKDIIISGGENISSVEVEQAVAAHPGVADASVIGVPDPTWVETPLAIIVPADPAAPPTLEEIREFVGARIASFKKPTRLEVVSELPRNASGKLQKHRLREAFGS